MDVVGLAKKGEAEVIDIRRLLHQNPEVSMQEDNTIQFVTEKLKTLGIRCERVPDGGIIGILDWAGPGKTLVLRSDLDALPIEEATENLRGNKVVVSKQQGVAHLCGHDAHMAMLLGAAKILAENREAWFGRVLFAFEQGEEMGGGIFNLLDRLVEIGADGVWGIHMKNDLVSGKISVDAGPRMAAIYPFHVEITGVGGHGSRPDLAASPVDCFHAFYGQLQAVRANTLNPFQPITYSIGSVHAGEKGVANVIPETLQFHGTARFLQIEQGRHFAEVFKETLEQVCAAHGCRYQFLRKTVPLDILVSNQEDCSRLAAGAMTHALGADVLAEHPAWMASEPFAFYQKYFPGVFAFVGTENAGLGTGAEHHNAQFDVDDEVLYLGVAATVQYTLDFLASSEPVDFVPEKRSVAELFKEGGF
jgi:amidohydrolase